MSTTSSEPAEPKGSEPSSNEGAYHLPCRCGHAQGHHNPYAEGGCAGYRCDCDGFKLELDDPPMTPDGKEEPRGELCACGCDLTAHLAWGDCKQCPEGVCDSWHEPPMTPEEEEQAPEDLALPPPEGPEYTPCVCGHIVPEHEPHGGLCYREGCGCCEYRTEPPPPQPERRPPYAVAYSVQGHLYEVALPGDATVRAVDGALVITHRLGPVAGIVHVAPIINKES